MLIRDIDWSPLYSCVTVKPAFDLFYSHRERIISMVFPLKSVTLTSRDPPYITPRIKYLLRERNRLMRRGRLELAGALSMKIGAAIARHNSARLSGAAFFGKGSG